MKTGLSRTALVTMLLGQACFAQVEIPERQFVPGYLPANSTRVFIKSPGEEYLDLSFSNGSQTLVVEEIKELRFYRLDGSVRFKIPRNGPITWAVSPLEDRVAVAPRDRPGPIKMYSISEGKLVWSSPDRTTTLLVFDGSRVGALHQATLDWFEQGRRVESTVLTKQPFNQMDWRPLVAKVVPDDRQLGVVLVGGRMSTIEVSVNLENGLLCEAPVEHEAARSYVWSADGKHLLLNYLVPPEDGALAVIQLGSGLFDGQTLQAIPRALGLSLDANATFVAYQIDNRGEVLDLRPGGLGYQFTGVTPAKKLAFLPGTNKLWALYPDQIVWYDLDQLQTAKGSEPDR